MSMVGIDSYKFRIDEPGKNLWFGFGLDNQSISSTPDTDKSIILKSEDRQVRDRRGNTSYIISRAPKKGDIFEVVLNRTDGTVKYFYNQEDTGTVF